MLLYIFHIYVSFSDKIKIHYRYYHYHSMLINQVVFEVSNNINELKG